ncbi:MAG: hypothetical protein KME30_02045 [Iphinoe sp. HA4291-MV1]|nr:hypothetical protein [Iphinoe sp. HA4291-MV1]
MRNNSKLVLGNGLFLSEGKFYHQQRKLAQPAFHTQIITSYGEVMVEETKRVIATWQDGQKRDVYHKISSKEELRTKLGGLTLGDAGAAIVVEPSDGKLGFLEFNLMSMSEYWHLCHVPEHTDWRHHPKGISRHRFYLDMPELGKLIRKYTIPYFKEYNRYRQQEFQEDPFYEHLALVVGHQISKGFIEEVHQAFHAPLSHIPHFSL